MNRQELAVLIPVLAVFFAGLVALSSTAIGKALARRIWGEQPDARRLYLDVQALHGEVEALRMELAETQERLDFAERLLAGQSESGHLIRPGLGAP
jgi:hypothetical protein